MSKKDLRDLKNFKGNDYGADFVLFPVDRKKTVEDIPNLEPHEVNVCTYIGDTNINATPLSNGNRKRLVKLIRVDKLVPPPQGEQLYKLLEEKKKAELNKPDKNSAESMGVEKTLHDLVDTFYEDVACEFKDAKGYDQKLNWWKNELGDIVLDEITPTIIESKKTLLKKMGKKPGTINRYLSYLQGAFRYGIKKKWFDSCPISFKKVERETEKKRVRWLDDNELNELFEALKKSESKDLEDLVHFSLNTGCRKSEALGLRWKDVDFKNGNINFRIVKRQSVCVRAEFNKDGKLEIEYRTQIFETGLKNGDDVKVLKMDNMPKVREILLKRRGNPELISKSEFVFPSNPRRSWDTLIRKLGFEDFRWHDLRHCCASYMRQDGKSLGLIGKHLGHKSSASTERYSHLSAEETLETGASISKRLYG